MSKRAGLRKAFVTVVLSASVATVGVALAAGTANAAPTRAVDCQAMEQTYQDADHFGAVAIQEQDFSDASHWFAMTSATKANHDRLCAGT